MKRILILLPAIFAVVVLRAQAPAVTTQQTAPDVSKVVDFKETDHDFGNIVYGKPVEFDLYMKNISPDSVKIENVSVVCGCTTPKWQAGPYAPGETFKVTVGFSGNANGPFSKQITVFFAGGLSKVIRFHGQGIKPPDNPAPANAPVQQLKPVN